MNHIQTEMDRQKYTMHWYDETMPAPGCHCRSCVLVYGFALPMHVHVSYKCARIMPFAHLHKYLLRYYSLCLNVLFEFLHPWIEKMVKFKLINGQTHDYIVVFELWG